MNIASSPEDEKLQALLRGARPKPALPPRFEENVWRRIEMGDKAVTRGESGRSLGLAGWLIKPKFALVLATIVVLAGAGLGWGSAQQQAQAKAQARYLAAVAPNSLR